MGSAADRHLQIQGEFPEKKPRRRQEKAPHSRGSGNLESSDKYISSEAGDGKEG
jgi:hypothetical protein